MMMSDTSSSNSESSSTDSSHMQRKKNHRKKQLEKPVKKVQKIYYNANDEMFFQEEVDQKYKALPRKSVHD